ncbi:LytR/AlgR family response regulator transcription factor [Carboxylicivirga sp. N1Y90]|uniref:LytR/AlgR family response regulator transcription factor n=1 Tax=Carboxylicivirga fragile TaxID=3417571 RepID=UPI003D357907|nr:response regulator transcription factor [Marinilabiliaceae bacterium N1Y90]
MKILLVEDEHLAAKRLEAMINKQRIGAQVLTCCDSIKQTVEWLETHEHPDIAFFDIQLGDGLSFEIFKQAKFSFPVVFTTAYDHYAINAFQVNGLDYLLKPIENEDLERALAKYEKGQQQIDDSFKEALLLAAKQLKTNDDQYKNRFLIKVGEHLKMVDTKQIAFSYSMDKANYIRTKDGHTYAIDQSLEQMELQLNPKQFFRISRKYLIQMDGIKDMISFGVARLKLVMDGSSSDEEIIVSRDKVKLFKAWLEN